MRLLNGSVAFDVLVGLQCGVQPGLHISAKGPFKLQLAREYRNFSRGKKVPFNTGCTCIFSRACRLAYCHSFLLLLVPVRSRLAKLIADPNACRGRWHVARFATFTISGATLFNLLTGLLLQCTGGHRRLQVDMTAQPVWQLRMHT